MDRHDHERQGAGRRRRENLLERITDDVKSWFRRDDGRDAARERFRASRAYRESRGPGGRDWGDLEPPSATGDTSRTRFYRRADDDPWGSDRHRTRGAPGRGGPGVVYAEHTVSPGPHAGVGPRGFRRSAETLKDQVCERLAHHGRVDASDIDVQCADDEITLTGTVRSRREKRLAEACAESVFGVRDVHNRLTIRPSPDQDQY